MYYWVFCKLAAIDSSTICSSTFWSDYISLSLYILTSYLYFYIYSYLFPYISLSIYLYICIYQPIYQSIYISIYIYKAHM